MNGISKKEYHKCIMNVKAAKMESFWDTTLHFPTERQRKANFKASPCFASLSGRIKREAPSTEFNFVMVMCPKSSCTNVDISRHYLQTLVNLDWFDMSLFEYKNRFVVVLDVRSSGKNYHYMLTPLTLVRYSYETSYDIRAIMFSYLMSRNSIKSQWGEITLTRLNPTIKLAASELALRGDGHGLTSFADIPGGWGNYRVFKKELKNYKEGKLTTPNYNNTRDLPVGPNVFWSNNEIKKEDKKKELSSLHKIYPFKTTPDPETRFGRGCLVRGTGFLGVLNNKDKQKVLLKRFIGDARSVDLDDICYYLIKAAKLAKK